MQLWRACFAAGTPLLTPDGFKMIEDFRVGDLVLSAPEDDPDAPVEPRRVEEVFQRVSPLIEIAVAGQRIKTTTEHPFYAQGRGWVPAGTLSAGDLLRGRDGSLVKIDAIESHGEVATVYNMRIAEYHTYFVGGDGWGFTVWAHNANRCFDVGAFEDLEAAAGFHRHHVPQTIAGLESLSGFSREIGPAIIIPDWMHWQISHVTLNGFLNGQNGNILAHINEHLQQLQNMGVPPNAINNLKRLILWWTG